MDLVRRHPGRCLLGGALLISLLAAPGSAQLPSGPRVPTRVFRLDNGLTVILHQDRSVPVVSVNTWYHVGSANEKTGRTGLAHLFEHLMFEGSKHVQEGEFDTLLEGAGGSNNGSTSSDRTNYYEDVPSNALELALFLESDRMGYLLDAMSPAVVDGQRDVVKNERRENYENAPYGMAWIELDRMLFPEGHPYSWPTIGEMEDLTAASYDDVVEFFKRYYVPNNASLAIAGDIDYAETAALVRKWFEEIPRGAPIEPVTAAPTRLTTVHRTRLTDRVQLPRLYLAWLSPALFASGDAALDVAAAILSDGKNSRLYKRLVFDSRIAQDVLAYQDSRRLAGSFQIIATARPGHTTADLQTAIDAEIDRLRREPPTPRELERVVNQIEARLYRSMERVGSYRGKAEQLNAYYTFTGQPDYFAKDLARYKALTPADIQQAITTWLPADRRVELVVEPAATDDPSEPESTTEAPPAEGSTP